VVGIENGHQAHLGQIEPLARRLIPTSTSKSPAGGPAGFHPLDGIDVRMEVPHPNTRLLEVMVRSSASVGQGGDQTRRACAPGPGFSQQVVDLPGHGTDADLRIDQAVAG